MEKSTHKVEVLPVEIQPHPDPETINLEIANVKGYQVLVRKGEFQSGDLGAYFPPDTLVDTTRPEFEFLKDRAKADGWHRIKAMKLRGQWSFGLLLPLPDELKHLTEGNNLADYYKVKHYDPEDQAGNQKLVRHARKPPLIHVQKYDIDNLQRYPHEFAAGEPLFVTEKIHGANGCFVYDEGHFNLWDQVKLFFGRDQEAFHVRSRKVWQKDVEGNTWWKAVKRYPGLFDAARERPGTVFFFEVFGYVQDLHYGMDKPGQVDLRVFDVRGPSGNFYDGPYVHNVYAREYDFPVVPIIASELPYPENPLDLIDEVAVGLSLIPKAKHMREGAVIRPMQEARGRYGRKLLKLVNPNYLARKSK